MKDPPGFSDVNSLHILVTVMPPSRFCLANSAQALANVLFGSSAVVASVGMNAKNVHPLLFGGLRAALTAVLLFGALGVSTLRERLRARSATPVAVPTEEMLGANEAGTGSLESSAATEVDGSGDGSGVPRSKPLLKDLFTKDRLRFFCMIATLYSGNVFNLIGVSLAGAVTASLWQPAQPVFTLFSAYMLGTEQPTLARTIGILLTVVGCGIMIAGSAAADEDHTGRASTGHSPRNAMLGNFCLLINCISEV